MRRHHLFYVLILVVLAVTGCDRSDTPVQSDQQSAGATGSRPTAPAPSPANLRGLEAADALALANEWMGNGVTTFVTPEGVNFEFPGGRKASVRLPADTMVVAFAPFINRTHPCEIHYMSGCQGELVGVPVDVVARLADGTVVVDDTIRTMSNGFIELWLPRDVEISIEMAAEGKSVRGTIGTFANSNTCITTLQLT